LPPVELATRVGSVEGVDPHSFYESEGAAVRARIESFLPPSWEFTGRRMLDFGCGSGRVLRHFLPEAGEGEFWGCDLHGPSIDWIQANLSPPLRCFKNELDPPLPFADGYLDLIWATSVFTHITDNWSSWLLELHRVLRQGGVLIASYLGEGVWEAMLDEPYLEDEVGMIVLRHWQEGPWVFHSEWWLRAHWGRLFDVVRVSCPPRGEDGRPQVTHSYIVMRKRGAATTRERLERCSLTEPRELSALRTNLRLLRAEIETVLGSAGHENSRHLLREAVMASPLRGPARRLGRRLRRGP